jgi:hypothetical protein
VIAASVLAGRKDLRVTDTLMEMLDLEIPCLASVSGDVVGAGGGQVVGSAG